MTNNSIYQYPSLYDDIMWWKKDDIEFWIALSGIVLILNIILIVKPKKD